MAKFELLTDGMAHKGVFYSKGDVVDFDDEVDVENLEERGLIGAEGTLKKREEEQAKRDEERAEWEAEVQARDEEEAARRFAESEGRTLPDDFAVRPERGEDKADDKSEGNPNVSAQDGPKTTERVNTRRR